LYCLSYINPCAVSVFKSVTSCPADLAAGVSAVTASRSYRGLLARYPSEMAKEGERSAADKGKGKVNDVRELNGEKKGVKEEKPTANGKKDEERKEGRQGP